MLGSQLKVKEGQLLGRVGGFHRRWVLISPSEIVAIREFSGRPGSLRVSTAKRNFWISALSSEYDAVVESLAASGHSDFAKTIAHKTNVLFYRRQFHVWPIMAALSYYLSCPLRVVVGWFFTHRRL